MQQGLKNKCRWFHNKQCVPNFRRATDFTTETQHLAQLEGKTRLLNGITRTLHKKLVEAQQLAAQRQRSRT